MSRNPAARLMKAAYSLFAVMGIELEAQEERERAGLALSVAVDLLEHEDAGISDEERPGAVAALAADAHDYEEIQVELLTTYVTPYEDQGPVVEAPAAEPAADRPDGREMPSSSSTVEAAADAFPPPPPARDVASDPEAVEIAMRAMGQPAGQA